MPRVDLTHYYTSKDFPANIKVREIPLCSANTRYTGVVYDTACDSMQGSYLDLPGHIKETDDGVRADKLDLADFYRMKSSVIHLDRAGTPGGVTAKDLEEAFGGIPDTEVVIINALGKKGPNEIPNRSVYLELDVVEFLAKTPCKLLVSDIYESQRLDGVFLQLFRKGISTVCIPENLWKLTSPIVELTVLFPKMPVTQVTCSMVAEF